MGDFHWPKCENLLENSQNWKLSKLNVVRIENCQNCKLPKLHVAKIASCLELPSCQVANLQVAKLWTCDYGAKSLSFLFINIFEYGAAFFITF